MQHFFVEPGQIFEKEKKILITGNDVNHIKNVLRMKIGEELSVSDGQSGREYRCGVAELGEDEIVCELRFIKEDNVELPAKIYLFQGLPKADKMELIIQKAVELGVYEIIPVATKRAVVKLDEKKAKSKIARWQGISEAAAKQSKRGIVPNVRPVMTMKEAILYAKDMDSKAIPYELAEGMQATKDWIASLAGCENIAVFIGPEGGFAEEEIEMAVESGICPVSLGKRILRTETAGLTTLSILMYHLETEGI
ncbi:MAG: 16S rRNA (uracil(1498)-N(3))-methyltransferase [Lachnospiraceae bacterium]|nr:16S rRNA (uracil(1498)-N(3))-methyltransferase [Lachnospiraceae bacterium]